MLKIFFKRLLYKKGYVIFSPIKHNGRIRFSISNYHYDSISPLANYTPWASDENFLEAYSLIKDSTLVDIFRCYEIWKLVEEAHKIGPGISILEVGVWKGGTSALILKKLALLGSTAKTYMADTFKGVAKVSEKDDFYLGGEHNETAKTIVEALLKNNINNQNYEILEGVFPDETSYRISDHEKFSFCHIDVDVYESAKGVVNWIWDRLIVGGIIIFDDYGFHWCTGITKFVEEQQKLGDRIVTYNLNGHALLIKVK